jgi:hypothetical protein
MADQKHQRSTKAERQKVLPTTVGDKEVYEIRVVTVPGEAAKATVIRNGKPVTKAKTHGLIEMALQEAGRNIRKDLMDRGVVK